MSSHGVSVRNLRDPSSHFISKGVIGKCTGWLRFTPGNGISTLLIKCRDGREAELVGLREHVDRVQKTYKGKLVEVSITRVKKGITNYTVTGQGGTLPKLVIVHKRLATDPVAESGEDDFSRHDEEASQIFHGGPKMAATSTASPAGKPAKAPKTGKVKGPKKGK